MKGLAELHEKLHLVMLASANVNLRTRHAQHSTLLHSCSELCLVTQATRTDVQSSLQAVGRAESVVWAHMRITDATRHNNRKLVKPIAKLYASRCGGADTECARQQINRRKVSRAADVVRHRRIAEDGLTHTQRI